MEQIEVMKQGGFSEAEWEAAQKSIENGYRQIEDSTRLLANFYELRSILGISESVDECLARFRRVSREQVVEAARRMTLEMIYFRQGIGARDGDEEDCDDEF